MRPDNRLQPQVRAEAVKTAVDSVWAGEKATTREGKTLVFERKPEFILNKRGEIVGVDAMVRMFDADGTEIPIDPHRVIVNPPTVPRSGIQETDTGQKDDLGRAIVTRKLTPDPALAWEEAVWDSVLAAPNPGGWRK